VIGVIVVRFHAMQWTRPTWAVSFDLIAYAVVLIAMLVAAGVWRLLGS
jgi:hypothetical protein